MTVFQLYRLIDFERQSVRGDVRIETCVATANPDGYPCDDTSVHNIGGPVLKLVQLISDRIQLFSCLSNASQCQSFGYRFAVASIRPSLPGAPLNLPAHWMQIHVKHVGFERSQ